MDCYEKSYLTSDKKKNQINSDEKIVFGRNVAGLIAARELALEFPDVREKI